jgi:ComF family protein
MRALLRPLFDLVLPAVCARCACAIPPAGAFCRRCERALPRFRGAAPPLLPASTACGAAVAYEGDVVTWLQRFKYPQRGFAGLDPAAQGVLRAWILEAAAEIPGERPDLIVPVALHARRLRARGFNPAGVLSRALARATGLRHDPTALTRVRDTPSQTGLSRRARQRNVTGAFRVRADLAGAPRIWLVDDVVTTGSTAAAAVVALRAVGVREIAVVCAARTPLSRHDASAEPAAPRPGVSSPRRHP